jgi:ATP phosphoribosyltransferase
MVAKRNDVRLALPSKGRMSSAAMEFLSAAGLHVEKPNPRQFEASIPALPGLSVLFQRASDIVVSVRDGSVDFGITGWDAFQEGGGENGAMLPLIQTLGFGHCRLEVIVPESWQDTNTMEALKARASKASGELRVATKFPHLTQKFFSNTGVSPISLIPAEGTLEAAPAIGYADLIVDLVSTGTTLRDNRLRTLDDGRILESQACLIANRESLRSRPEVLEVGRLLVEFLEAHLRAIMNVSIFANIRGESPAEIADQMFNLKVIGGLEGPTISPVVSRKEGDWYAVHIIVRRDQLPEAIRELRSIGGSGVVVTPVMYIFEEHNQAYQAMLEAIND